MCVQIYFIVIGAFDLKKKKQKQNSARKAKVKLNLKP